MKPKKFLSVLLCIILVCSAAVIPTQAAQIDESTAGAAVGIEKSGEDLTYGDYKYSVNDDGTVTIKKYSGSASELTIPNTIDGKSVTSIGYEANGYAMGDYAFSNCTSLTRVTVPDTVTSICAFAFCQCTSLTSITIPDCVTSIGERVFYGCTKLTSIEVSSNNANYKSVDGILYDKDVTTLISCPGGKTSVTIPDSVTSIGSYAFSSCTSLISVTIPDGVTSIGDSAFYFCTNLTSITIPDGVTSIGTYTFMGCTSLTYIVIPVSVTSIGNYAFQDCASLKDVYFGGTEDEWNSITIQSGNDALASADKHFINPDDFEYYEQSDGSLTILKYNGNYKYVYIPSEKDGKIVKSIGEGFANDNIEGINIPDTVKYIGFFACVCKNLKEIHIPDSVTDLEEGAFSRCISLRSVNISNSLTTINDSVFEHCESLTTVSIPESVKSIGNNSFDSCISLDSIIIPESVTSIGNSAFVHCDSLIDVYYSGTKEQWNNITIGSDNEPLTKATIHYKSGESTDTSTDDDTSASTDISGVNM